MLDQLEITNFQSHGHTVFNFHPGVNFIIGDSGNGKTASLRALNLLAKNRPLKFKFHSDFAKISRTSVKAITAEGAEVKIVKTKKKTKYTLISDGKKGEWPKLNKKVPDRVKDALNISDLNIQWQFDNPFLISASPGEIARVINEKTKIEEADEWIRILNKNITSLKNEKQTEEVELEVNITELKGLSDLPKLNRLLNRITAIDKRVKRLDDQYIRIDSILASIEDIENKIKEQRRYLKAKKQLTEIESIDEEIEKLLEEELLIKRVLQLQIDISLSNKEKKEYINKYIKLLKKHKKCPVCFNTVGTEDIERIAREISTAF